MRSTNTLVLVAVVTGCGPDSVEPIASPVRCEPGPALTIERVPCPITVEGSGGPTAAELLTLVPPMARSPTRSGPRPTGVYSYTSRIT